MRFGRCTKKTVVGQLPECTTQVRVVHLQEAPNSTCCRIGASCALNTYIDLRDICDTWVHPKGFVCRLPFARELGNVLSAAELH